MYGPKVKEICRENNWHIYLGEDKEGNDISESQVNHHLMDTNDVFILPAVEGSGRVGQIILGIVMIVIGIIIIYGSWGTMTPQGLAAMGQGVIMIVGGLSTIYMALNTPKAQDQRAGPDERASFIFNGAANVVEQGGAVPCVYGRFRTGSTVVSAGIDTGEMTGGYYGGGWNGGDGGHSGCVTTDSMIFGTGLANTVKVGDYMTVIDPITYETAKGLVTRADVMSQPCVRITSESGVVLECSTSAPIADANGNEVLAPNLLGVSVLVDIDGIIKTEKVVSVEDIGLKDIVFITCENNFFLAGAEEGKHFLHHNAKNTGYSQNPGYNELFDIYPV
jgi:predicted phage tail protein